MKIDGVVKYNFKKIFFIGQYIYSVNWHECFDDRGIFIEDFHSA